MPSFWADELSAWMRLGERMVGDGVESLAELTGRALRPWADVVEVATSRLAGRAVEYEAGGVTGRATIESFRVVAGDPAKMATDIEAVLREPRWGEHSAEALTVKAHGVHMVPGPVAEVRAEQVELAASFGASTVAGWFASVPAIRLVSLGADGLTVLWRWRRLQVTVQGAPAAAGDRLHLVARRLRLAGRAMSLPAAPEITVAVPLRLPRGLALTGADVEGDSLVVRAVAHNTREPVRPDRILSALDGRGAVRLYRPSGGTGVR